MTEHNGEQDIFADLLLDPSDLPQIIARRQAVPGGLGLNARVSSSLGPGWMERVDQIRCPMCGFEYVHFRTPALIDAADDYQARPDFVRGNVIVVPMWCEDGHSFTLEIGFHKGGTFVRWAGAQPSA